MTDEQVMHRYRMGDEVIFRNGLDIEATGTCQGWSRDMLAPHKHYMLVQVGRHEHLKRISLDRIIIGGGQQH